MKDLNNKNIMAKIKQNKTTSKKDKPIGTFNINDEKANQIKQYADMAKILLKKFDIEFPSEESIIAVIKKMPEIIEMTEALKNSKNIEENQKELDEHINKIKMVLEDEIAKKLLKHLEDTLGLDINITVLPLKNKTESTTWKEISKSELKDIMEKEEKTKKKQNN
ncbi:MAG: hypothetical protein FWG85_01015 [Bacteroidetes bacterium]|nr:hypothetical protein [Bacteroidota bacterium]